MKNHKIHWTAKSIANYVFSIGADFVAQLEAKLEEKSIAQKTLSNSLHITQGAVSQALNNPGNLTIQTMVKYAKALGMNVSIVLYENNDTSSEEGPINADIFRICWERAGKPKDFFELKSVPSTYSFASYNSGWVFNAGQKIVLTGRVADTSGAIRQLGLIQKPSQFASTTWGVAHG